MNADAVNVGLELAKRRSPAGPGNGSRVPCVGWRHAALEKIVASRGYELAPVGSGIIPPGTVYTPFPDLDEIPDSLWEKPRPLLGVDLRVDEATDLLAGELSGFLEEFRPAMAAGDGFYLDNGEYTQVDAETLYAVLRHLQPSRVVEFGSGASSQVIAAARVANGGFDYHVYDPFPFGPSPFGPVEATVHQVRGEHVDANELAATLVENDVLFIDTTHQVKTGGEVEHLILDVLPRLRPGVWVHFHDVFLPWDYPRAFVVGKRSTFAEQYLLEAFLAFNPTFRVELPAFALWREQPGLVKRLIPSSSGGACPGAFWISRIG